MLSKILSRPKNPEEEQAEMSFLDHFDALRKHLFRASFYVITATVLIFFQKKFIFDTIILGPTRSDFPTFRFFCWLSEWTCFKVIPPQIFTRELSEQLTVHLMVSFFLGLIIAFPLLVREIWLFVKPGLYEKERRATRGVVEVCSLLFLTGVIFGYFIIAPFSISFLSSYQVSESIQASATLSSIVDSMIMFTMSTGLVFELPMGVYFLAKLGIMGPEFMRTYRRHAIVVISIVAAIITPPDVTSMVLVGLPLCLLYEVSIIVAKRVYPKETEVTNYSDNSSFK